jgi:gluconate 2-dehydrogenase gamma chain
MKRRDNIKLLFAGGVGAGILGQASCKADVKVDSKEISSKTGGYGRTKEEIDHDSRINADKFFTDEEMKTVQKLSDLIIPKDEEGPGALEVGVPDFIEFMVKDQPSNQVPIRGGLKWLDNLCLAKHNLIFTACTETQQMEVLDLIAYPDTALPEHKPGVKFFNLMRNLVATGFFTTKEGYKYIGYVGNTPNEWDGVPDEILKKHGLSYDPKYADIYVKPSERNTLMTWEEG